MTQPQQGQDGEGGGLGAWQFAFDAPVGTRILGGRFMGIVTEWAGRPLWWDHVEQEWINDEERRARNNVCSSHAPCRSFKAFKRHLRRHRDKLAGYEVVLVSRFIGHDIAAVACDAPNPRTAAMDRLIADSADLIDNPADEGEG